MITHNFKVALRNLMKYKLQTLISVISIAVGIVTLSLTHSVLQRYQLPSIYFESYYDRAYTVSFRPITDSYQIQSNKEYAGSKGVITYSITDGDQIPLNKDIVRAIKGNGGLRNAEQIAIPNGWSTGIPVEFHLTDSTIRKGNVGGIYIDPQYPNYIGLRSAITGKKIRVLKEGEAIISEDFAKKYFLGKNPIGAIQTLTIFDIQPIPVTIVDVYKTSRVTDFISSGEILYYCIANNIEDLDLEKCFTAILIDVALKENSTHDQLLKEINDRVKPLGLTAGVTKVADQTQINLIITIRLLGYMIGSLILLSAIIGFLRIQTQLFRIRRREMSLRLVNGATRLKLFGLLFTEVSITICLAVIVALFLGGLLQDFCDNKLNLFIDGTGVKIKDLGIVSLEIGGALLVICSLIAWIMLQRIVKSAGGLSVNMRRSRNHIFRNVMLGIQIVISFIFVSSTFILVNAGDKILKACNVPENDDFYRDCLYLEPTGLTDRNTLLDAIKRLPELEKMIMANNGYHAIKEVGINPELKDKFSNQEYFKTYCVQDTSLVSLLGMDVDWLTQSNNRNEGLLISENLYNRFNELGLLDNNSLTIIYSWNSQPTLPIIGIIRKMPYDIAGETLVALQPEWEDLGWEYILVPKKGKGKALEQSVNETIERLYPQLINKMVFNYREKTNELPGFVEAVRAGGWILGGISLVICAMTIFSTIALDTRARRKEVAIRKVNGAKSKDIYQMFGRTYIVLIIISLFIAVPVCVIFNSFVETFVTDLAPKSTVSPVLPIILGCSVVILLILSIIGWQIHKVMQIDPAKIIAKE